jgi:galactokinase
MPIGEAAFAIVQASRTPGVLVVSVNATWEKARRVELTGSEWDALVQADYDTARQTLQERGDSAWAAYVLGPMLVLLREMRTRIEGGLRIVIDSRVAEGKGVSSSAALEVATMRAVAELLGLQIRGEEIARLCQVAENRVVGAPCGIMDQMTSALGRENELLALRCQPATVEGFVPIPNGVAFWGIDSGIRHVVSGADYTSVRCGAFMGYRIIAEAAGLNVKPASGEPGVVEIEDHAWNGYLANIRPAEFREQFAKVVPTEMTGRIFLDRFGGTTDRVTRVDPARTYAVLWPTLHPIEENERVQRFRQLLQGVMDEKAMLELGELMFAAHDSYSACGLGSDGTDSLVKLVREVGPTRGLYGAKITGGGSGGAVVVLGRADAGAAVEQVARQYAKDSGRQTFIFRGSSAGACAAEVVKVIAGG